MTNYTKGRSREYALMKKLKGDIIFRSAGSHSKVDIVCINKASKTITLIQAKPKSMSHKAKQRLQDELNWLNDEFMVKFATISTIKELT